MQPNPSDIDHLNWLKKANLESFKNFHVLDLGCGSGFLCHKAIEDGARSAVGIDIVKPKGASGSNGWEFRSTNLDSESWHNDFATKFDQILAFDIIEHLNSPFGFLNSCRHLLNDSGNLVLTTPNTLSWERFQNPTDWSGAHDPQHKVLFTKYSLEFLLKKVGFSKLKLSAPMRSLSFLGPLQPQIGGQILCVASV